MSGDFSNIYGFNTVLNEIRTQIIKKVWYELWDGVDIKVEFNIMKHTRDELFRITNSSTRITIDNALDGVFRNDEYQ